MSWNVEVPRCRHNEIFGGAIGHTSKGEKSDQTEKKVIRVNGKMITHPQDQRNGYADRGEAGKNTHCPFVTEGIKHGSTEQGENGSTDAT
jgi:hypothetical protein